MYYSISPAQRKELAQKAAELLMVHVLPEYRDNYNFDLESMVGYVEDVFGPSFVGTLSEAAEKVKAGEFDNFLYLQNSDIFLGDLDSGCHEVLMGLLYDMFHKGNERGDYTTGAEKFLKEGYCLVQSSAAYSHGSITLGTEYRMTAQEKIIFREYQQRFIYRGRQV